MINYDRNETEGLTTRDIVEAISATYGTATSLTPAKIAFPSPQVDYDSETFVARWEDAPYSFSLYRSASQSTYEMSAFSKNMDPLARAATAEALRLDALGAPQREAHRQQMEDAKNRESLAKARQENKSKFRL